MAKRGKRNNAGLANWLRAIAIAGLTWGGMAGMHAQPLWFPAAIGLLAGAIALANAELGILLAIVGLCLPVLAVNPIVGILMAVVLFAAERYLGGGEATPFLLIGLAIVGAYAGPVWAAAALAGYLLGPSEGALAAVASCVALESVGVLTAPGSAIGVTGVFAGTAPRAAVAFGRAPATLLSTDWIAASFKSMSASSVNLLFSAVGHAASPAELVGQPIVWALAAVVAGLVVQRAGRDKLWVPLAAVAGGVGVAWAGDAVLRIGLGLPLSGSGSAIALVASLVVALGWVAASETVFARVAPPARTAAVGPATMATEDADVDELLRLIATAEDKLASQHTSQRVVLITDMKSFSSMTEEDGSMASAKAIQRHRDLLVPVITRMHGCGKSTGGDGIVAAFESAADAIRAAVEGQRALATYNASHPNERQILVRMGLAEGEVVLDNGGRPFIGTGLNLAARVMNLADGGHIYATGSVASAAQEAGAPARPLGEFELKNIASPVEIDEIVWESDTPPAETPAD